jgi:hypothetical protein
MTPQVLHITYKFDGTRADFERDFAPIAATIAEVPGMRWKIWLFDEATSRGGGSYLFEDTASLGAYLDGPIVDTLRTHPAFSEVTVQAFSVLEAPTAITRGPVAVTLGS